MWSLLFPVVWLQECVSFTQSVFIHTHTHTRCSSTRWLDTDPTGNTDWWKRCWFPWKVTNLKSKAAISLFQMDCFHVSSVQRQALAPTSTCLLPFPWSWRNEGKSTASGNDDSSRIWTDMNRNRSFSGGKSHHCYYNLHEIICSSAGEIQETAASTGV